MLKTFRIVAFLEGVSYLVVLYNMIINKNYFPELYKSLLQPFGMGHGVLFVAYVVLTFLLIVPQKWTFKDVIIILVASLLPFATFWVEKKYGKSV